MDLQKLRRAVKGAIAADQETLEDVSSDFGRLSYGPPAVVVGPASSDDVRRVIELANEEGWSVSARGSGHSQGGQSLAHGGILLDMTALNRLSSVERDSIWVEAGVLWRDLLNAVVGLGRMPMVLTGNLDVTVGGTISTAGLGAGSHRLGTQADNVEELEVVTGTGDLVRCSPRENVGLFNSVRCGLGQFGVITRVRLKLRRCSPSVRTFFLLYDNVETLMEDQARILREQLFDYVEGWCSPCEQGYRSMAGSRVPFAEWFYPLHLSVEYAGVAPARSFLKSLRPYREVHQEDTLIEQFAARMDPVYQVWRESGSWRLPHPWMQVILPWDRAAEYVQGVLRSFPSSLLQGGLVSLWPCRGAAGAPLFVRPEGEFVLGFGILPAVPRRFVEMAAALLDKAGDLALQLGGRRYLAGWMQNDEPNWEAHFGDLWPQVVQWKRFFDPNGILSRGSFHFSTV